VTRNVESHTIDLERSITLFVDPVHTLVVSSLEAHALEKKLIAPFGLAITGKDCRFEQQSLGSMFKVLPLARNYKLDPKEQCLFKFSSEKTPENIEDFRCFSVKTTDVGNSRPKFVTELNPKFFILDCLDGNKYYIPFHILQSHDFVKRSETEICQWMKTGQGDRKASVVLGGSACKKHETKLYLRVGFLGA